MDTDGQHNYDSKLSLDRVTFARCSRSLGRGGLWGYIRRDIFASLSVQRGSAHYHLSANKCYVRAIVFCGDAGCREHFERNTDRAFFRHTRFQYGPANKSARLLTSQRRPERDGSFKRQYYSAGLLHALYPKLERRSFSSENHANQRHSNTNANADTNVNSHSHAHTDAYCDSDSYANTNHSHSNTNSYSC